MPVDLLISPPATGKTEACIQRIRTLLEERPFAPVRVALPDRLQTTAFRRRLAEAGGAIGVQVGTFGDLYREVLELNGRPVPIASQPMVHRLVRAAVEKVHADGELQYYAGLREMPGFILTLREAFAEFKRALVFPEILVERTTRGNPALDSPAQQELARIYLAYQNKLRDIGWADPEGLSWLAVETLQNNPGLASGLALLVVDGFDSFTGVQRQALQLLAPGVPEILITLPGELPLRRTAHRRFAAAYQELSASLTLRARGLSRHSFLPAPLQHIEASLFEAESERTLPGEHLKLIEARSPAEEAREALRWLKARVVRDGIPLQACAVVTPDPNLYHPYLHQASAEFGVPLRFTQGEVLAQSPAITAILALLNLPALNYPRRPLLDAIRSPYFDLSMYTLDRRKADILDEASRYGQVIEGREQWDEVFDRLAQSKASIDVEDESELRLPSLPHGEQAFVLQRALNRFFERLSPPRSTNTLTNWIRWLEDLLDEWRFYELGTGERDLAAFENFRETLRALVLGDTVIGAQTIDYTQFLTELQGALESAGYQEPLPGGQPAALVLRMLEARAVRFQAVAVLGLSEGIFPEVERGDPFLDEMWRQELGLESRLQREQPGLFYQVLTRADCFILLTRPYLADDGEKWEASPYWKAVVNLLSEKTVKTIRPDDPIALNEAASAEEALFWAVRRHSLPQSYTELLPRWEYLRHAREVLHARQSEQAAGPYEGFAESLADLMQARYSENHVWSASRLEEYGTCPHQFYIRSALEVEAKAPPELGLDAAQLGTLLHLILEQAYASAENPGDYTAVLAVLPEMARQVFENAPLEQGFRPSPLWQVEQDQILLVLEATVQRLAEQDTESGWMPIAFEQSFGREGAAPLVIQIEGQIILLHGVVDRIDRDRTGRLRIIDYKTGGSHLAKQDLILGRRLQLPLYALAVQDVLGMGEVAEGLYWTLLRGEAGSLKLSSFKSGDASGPQAVIEIAKEHLSRIVPGIRQAQFPPVPPKGGCPAYCPASAWCWRYVPGWGA
jgi:ATP-dependent helicase/nuclease subunit B